jgi:hypothetical protein
MWNRFESAIHSHRKHRLRLIRVPLPHPAEGESLDIPGYCQLDTYSCGAVAGWMVLKAIHPNFRFQEFYAKCSPSPEDGLDDHQLLKALRAFGIGYRSIRAGTMTFGAITRCINEGFPILAIVDRPTRDVAHWVVVYGYGETNKRQVYVAGNNFLGLHKDDHGGPNPMTYREFSRLSREFNAYACWGRECPPNRRLGN